MREAPKFAIIGSCCTRDLFEFGIQGFAPRDVSLYVTRTTARSMVADPIPREVRRWSDDELTGFHLERFAWDLDKRYFELLDRTRWDVLLIDFVTEYHPTMTMGAAAAAAVPRVRHYLDPLVECGEAAIVPARTEPEKTFRACRTLGARLAGLASGRPVVLHQALRAKCFMRDGKLVPFASPAAIDVRNDYTLDCGAALAEGSCLTEVRLPLEDIVAGGEHRWHLSPLHYQRPYYERLADVLDQALS